MRAPRLPHPILAHSSVVELFFFSFSSFFLLFLCGSPCLQARARSETKRKRLAELAHKLSHKERQDSLAARRAEQRRKEAEIIAADPTSELARELLRKKEAKEAKAAKKAKSANIKVMR